MKSILSRGAALLLALTVLASLWVPASAASEDGLAAAVERAAAYVLAAVPEPTVGNTGGEWAVLGLARSGYDVPQSYWARYAAAVEETVTACQGVLHQRKYTEYARVALALTAIGADPTAVAGYDLLVPLGDFEKTVWQGVNGPIWALLALDSRGYDMPVNPDANIQATRQLYVEEILSRQLEDGGWNLTDRGGSGEADPDVTAMALQALSGYRDQTAVSDAAARGLACLSAVQNGDGGYASGGVPNAESAAQVLVALCALDVSWEDPRFVKNGRTVLDCLLGYQQPDGSFRHTAGGSGSSQMATEQGLYALTAALRALRGENSLYRMDDAVPLTTTGPGLPGKHPDVQPPAASSPGVTFPDIPGQPCETAAVALSARGVVTGFTDGSFRPDDAMTRAQFAAVTVRALGLPLQTAAGFRDVRPTDWCASWVGTAHAYGIVNGRTADTFDPNGAITRQEAAVMTARAAVLCGMDTALTEGQILDALSPCADAQAVGSWARESVAFCYREGIFDGQKLEPARAVTRGEMVRMLYRLLDRAGLLGGTA